MAFEPMWTSHGWIPHNHINKNERQQIALASHQKSAEASGLKACRPCTKHRLTSSLSLNLGRGLPLPLPRRALWLGQLEFDQRGSPPTFYFSPC